MGLNELNTKCKEINIDDYCRIAERQRVSSIDLYQQERERERETLVSRRKVKVKEAEMFSFDSGLFSSSTLNRKCRLKQQQHTEDLSARVRSGPHWLFLKHPLKLFFSP